MLGRGGRDGKDPYTEGQEATALHDAGVKRLRRRAG
jgi:hypothetical protein